MRQGELLPAETADAHLYHGADFHETARHAGVTIGGVHVRVAKIAVGVQVEDGEIGATRLHGPHGADGDGVLTTQKSHQPSPIVIAFDGLGNPPNHRLRAGHVRLQGCGSVDACQGEVEVQLVIVVLQIVGSGEDGGGAVPRAGAV